MATIAVTDAQIKGEVAFEELVKKSPWWKRLKKRNKDTVSN
jgi:malate dehydrogenase (oxaloacetate-decarboxylating)(NADP+)